MVITSNQLQLYMVVRFGDAVISKLFKLEMRTPNFNSPSLTQQFHAEATNPQTAT